MPAVQHVKLVNFFQINVYGPFWDEKKGDISLVTLTPRESLTMKLTRQNLRVGSIAKGNSALLRANVDRRPPLQQGLMNFQL